MTSSAQATLLSEVEAKCPSARTRAYFQTRLRGRYYDLVIRKFKDAGISQAELARRTGKRPEVVNRLLASPGNWGLDTLSDLLLAIAGEEPDVSSSSPVRHNGRNHQATDDFPKRRPLVVFSTESGNASGTAAVVTFPKEWPQLAVAG